MERVRLERLEAACFVMRVDHEWQPRLLRRAAFVEIEAIEGCIPPKLRPVA